MNIQRVLTLCVLAFPGGCFAQPVPAGEYAGTATTLAPVPATRACAALVVPAAGRNLAQVAYPGSGENRYEEWIWDDQTLTVRVHQFIPGNQRPDRRMHKEVYAFTALASGGRYHLQAADLAFFDLGLDARSYWTLRTTDDGLSLEAWAPADRSLPGEAVLRQRLALTRRP